MIIYVIKKMKKDKKETIGNILFVSCVLMVLTICCHIIWKINGMVKNGWYKESIEVASIGDPFIREKMGAILWVTMILMGLVMIFCMILYALKIKMDITKERQRISVFQVLGYSSRQRIAALYVGKLIEAVEAFMIAEILALVVWKYLCRQEKFYGLMTMMNESVKFQWRFGLLTLAVLAVWGLCVICVVIQKKENVAEVLKGAEHE